MRTEPLRDFFEDLWTVHTRTIDGVVASGFIVVFVGRWLASLPQRSDWFMAILEMVFPSVLMLGLVIRARLEETGIGLLNLGSVFSTMLFGSIILWHAR